MAYKKNIKTVTPINIWKYLLILVGIFSIFPLYRYIINQLKKNDEAETTIEQYNQAVANTNPITQQTNADKITTNKDVQKAARELAHHLGTKYNDDPLNWWSSLDPRGWTENDAEVSKIVVYQRNNYKLLVSLYYNIYSNKRNLSNDLLKLLDEKELSKITKYIKL